MNVENILHEFNKDYESSAKLVSAEENLIVIEMKGKSEQAIENNVHALRERIESVSNQSFIVQKISKSGNTFTITFSVEKKPSEDILKILEGYDEGTSPRDYVPEE